MRPRGRSGHRSGPRRGGNSRGRGGSNRFGKRPRFDSSRVEQKEEGSAVESSQDESLSDDVPEGGPDNEDENEDVEQETAPSRPYITLLRSLTETAAPKAKRRKLGLQDKSDRSLPKDDDSKDLDLVDEPEEAPEDGLAEDASDDEDAVDGSDPFVSHFSEPDGPTVTSRLKSISMNEWASEKIASKSLRMVVSIPKTGTSDEISLPATISGPSVLNLKRRLKEAIVSQRPEFDSSEKALAGPLFQYYDALYCLRTVANGDNLRRLVCLHALNHVFKTRDRVIKNSAKLAREDANEDLELRDQGFTRPKVLVLLPTRQSCVKMVRMICSLTDVDQQENRKRFDDSYVDDEKFRGDKPPDFKDLFEGNNDDMFRLGVKFTRKTIKYFAQFYNSDILFASPLGLRMAIGSMDAEKKKKKLDFDFLSSIELVIVDQADALLMQNWEHVEYIFEHMNLQPKDAHGCDFSRVRSWSLDGQAKHFRQTVILSAFNNPELSELFRSQCLNWAGKVRVQPEYQGLIQNLAGGIRAKQTFSRFESPSIAGEPDARFTYFTKAIMPTLTKRAGKDSTGTLIFIPSYMDFVRVRNYFATSPAAESLSFGAVSDYTDVPEASRCRSHFASGRQRVLLYTERAHHFWRHQFKGVKRVIMYGLPENPIFYQEVAGGYLARSEQDLTLEPGQGSVRVLFCKYDVLKLERAVGTHRVGKMLQEKGDTFDFV